MTRQLHPGPFIAVGAATLAITAVTLALAVAEWVGWAHADADWDLGDWEDDE